MCKFWTKISYLISINSDKTIWRKFKSLIECKIRAKTFHLEMYLGCVCVCKWLFLFYTVWCCKDGIIFRAATSRYNPWVLKTLPRIAFGQSKLKIFCLLFGTVLGVSDGEASALVLMPSPFQMLLQATNTRNVFKWEKCSKFLRWWTFQILSMANYPNAFQWRLLNGLWNKTQTLFSKHWFGKQQNHFENFFPHLKNFSSLGKTNEQTQKNTVFMIYFQ